jgi:hypothetical protein
VSPSDHGRSRTVGAISPGPAQSRDCWNNAIRPERAKDGWGHCPRVDGCAVGSECAGLGFPRGTYDTKCERGVELCSCHSRVCETALLCNPQSTSPILFNYKRIGGKERRKFHRMYRPQANLLNQHGLPSHFQGTSGGANLLGNQPHATCVQRTPTFFSNNASPCCELTPRMVQKC